MKITTYEMPVNMARERARRWYVKADEISFVYNENKTRARLIILSSKYGRAIKQYFLMSSLPRTERGQKLSQVFKEWQKSTKCIYANY